MQIKIINIDIGDDEIYVIFSSQYGDGRAKWIGSHPKMLVSYFVELGCEDILIMGDNLRSEPIHKFRMSRAGNSTILSAVVENVFDATNASLSFGDVVFLVEFMGDFLEPGVWVTVVLNTLEINDINL